MKLPGIFSLVMWLILPGALAQPHSYLHEADEALHRVQTSLDPADLRAAQQSLENAIEFARAHRKPAEWGLPERREALDDVVQALKALEDKDRIKAAKCIEQALKLTNEAVSAHPKKK
jgi:hypothetical protein